MTRTATLAAVLIAAAACDRHPPLASCEDSLHGVWRSETGQRWMIIEPEGVLRVYPLFNDGRGAPTEVVAAPRVIELARSGSGATGEVSRWFMRRADICVETAPAHLVSCRDAELELVLADPVAPLGFAPCVHAATEPSRRERWRRDRD